MATTTIYRKPTHSNRLLDQSLYNPTSHKATTIRTLTRWAQLVRDSPDSLQDETDYLNNGMVTLTITLLSTIYRQNIELTGTLQHNYQRLTLESWFTNLEQTPLNRSQQLPAPYKRLIDGIKQN